ncbi:MAG TPA: DNA methyltransferase [Puia sp.]|nr:DNA methyltransferase [Puia sp.]
MKPVNTIYQGDCLFGLREWPDGFVDACVTDPPYGIAFMGKKWDHQVPGVDVWSEVLRVLKPGAHLLCACGTRTQHRMAVNIEDAGFEIRDVICWHYGSGFPKSLDISKAIDKAAGAEREVIGEKGLHPSKDWSSDGSKKYRWDKRPFEEANALYAATTEDAKKWEGWGTALKPATEFWTLARKRLEGKTVAENIVRYGTGGLNIDGSRIESTEKLGRINNPREERSVTSFNLSKEKQALAKSDGAGGRFPANLVLDEFMAAEMDRQTGVLTSGKPAGQRNAQNKIYGQYGTGMDVTGYGDSGGGSRFFYVAKADGAERGPGNNHPTVKPLALMQYLIKLICPLETGRLVVDPFAGSGSTCIAARLLGVDFIGFEWQMEYLKIAEERFRRELALFNDARVVYASQSSLNDQS